MGHPENLIDFSQTDISIQESSILNLAINCSQAWYMQLTWCFRNQFKTHDDIIIIPESGYKIASRINEFFLLAHI